jgi:hypothetical protein
MRCCKLCAILCCVGSWVAEPPGILDLDSKLGTAVAKKPGSVRVKYLLNNQVGGGFSHSLFNTPNTFKDTKP